MTELLRRDGVRLSEATLSELAAAVKRGVPPGPCAELRQLCAARVARPPYYARLSGLDALPEADWPAALRSISLALGELVAQDGESRFGGHYHTDGAELALPAPSYVALACVRPAVRGGATVLVDARTVLAEVRARSPVASLRLFEPFHFDRGGTGTVEKPVFYRRGDQLGVSYLRPCIDAAYQQVGVPMLDDEGRAALDCLDAVLDRHDAVIANITLARGEILLCNNTALLHGCTELVDEASRSPRLLRTWIRA